MTDNTTATIASKESISLHIRTYRSVLKSSQEIDVSTLIPTYLKMQPLLHSMANDPTKIDLAALRYCLHRLPKEIFKTKLVIIGQTRDVFTNSKYDLSQWKFVSASHRRRPTFYNQRLRALASLASSISDVDDIVNLLIAFQIELTKFIRLKKTNALTISVEQYANSHGLIDITKVPQIKIKMLESGWTNFGKYAQMWWRELVKTAKPNFDLENQPIVFVSSNNHSLVNLVDGFCLKHKKKILTLFAKNSPDQFSEIKETLMDKNKYLVYFASKSVFLTDKDMALKKQRHEKMIGIVRIPASRDFAVETQIIPGKLISPKLVNTAVINIEYPLGFAAYHVLEEILENNSQVKGVYILGKAAALNTKVGDIMIPKIVFDEQTQNTFLVNNSFNNNFPYVFRSGSILDNQRLVSVLGTFLENKDLFDEYSQKEFNVIEMEAGPYLSAVAQATYIQPVSSSTGAIIDLSKPPFDLGLIYYSSDNPYTLSQTVSTTAGIAGIEATYLGTKAIIERIKKEAK